MTESRAVSTITGIREPWARSSLEHLEPVDPGQPDVEDHQVEARRSAPGRAPRRRRRRWWCGSRRPAGPWRRTRRSAPRPRRSGSRPCVPVLHAVRRTSSAGSTGGSVITNLAPAGSASSTVTVPAVRLGDRRDDGQAEPEPLVAGAVRRCGRTARRSAPGPRRVRRARCRAPTAAPAAVVRRARARPRPWCRVCLTALSASWSTAWVIRCSSIATMPSPASSSTPVPVGQRRVPWPAACG